MQEPRHYHWGHVAAAVITHNGPAARSVLSLALEDSQFYQILFEARTEAHRSATSVRPPRKVLQWEIAPALVGTSYQGRDQPDDQKWVAFRTFLKGDPFCFRPPLQN